MMPRPFLDGILLTCIFTSASPVQLPPPQNDATSNRTSPLSLNLRIPQPLTAACTLRSVTKGPKCSHSLCLSSPFLTLPPFVSSSSCLSPPLVSPAHLNISMTHSIYRRTRKIITNSSAGRTRMLQRISSPHYIVL